jgi:hypothetical protein
MKEDMLALAVTWPMTALPLRAILQPLDTKAR